MRTVRLFLIVVAAITSWTAQPVAAQSSDPHLARNLASTCFNCHGPDGVSRGEVASLAGQKKDDLVLKMQEFKAGKRPATIMHQLAKGYTDAQIELIANWFADRRAK